MKNSFKQGKCYSIIKNIVLCCQNSFKVQQKIPETPSYPKEAGASSKLSVELVKKCVEYCQKQ